MSDNLDDEALTVAPPVSQAKPPEPEPDFEGVPQEEGQEEITEEGGMPSEEHTAEENSEEDEDDAELNKLLKDDDPESFKKRINKLHYQKKIKEAELAKENELLREELARANSQGRPEVAGKAESEEPQVELYPYAAKPNLKAFNGDMAAYIEARDEWEEDTHTRYEANQKILAEHEKEVAHKRQIAAHEEQLQQSLIQQCEVAKKKYADFDAVVKSVKLNRLPETKAMDYAVASSDKAAEIYYYLAKNPDEWRKVAAMDPMTAARAVGRLEAKLLHAAPKVDTPNLTSPTKKLSGAGGQGLSSYSALDKAAAHAASTGDLDAYEKVRARLPKTR